MKYLFLCTLAALLLSSCQRNSEQATTGETLNVVCTVGMIADITVFDPATVADRSDYTDPHHYPTGIIHVIVNGEPVLLDGEMTGAKPGRFLERAR